MPNKGKITKKMLDNSCEKSPVPLDMDGWIIDFYDVCSWIARKPDI